MALNIDNIKGPSSARSASPIASQTSGPAGPSTGLDKEIQLMLKLLDMILKELDGGQDGGKDQGPGGPGGPAPLQPKPGMPAPPTSRLQSPVPPLPPQQTPVAPQQTPVAPQQSPVPPQQTPPPQTPVAPQQTPVAPQPAQQTATPPDMSPQQIAQNYGKEIDAASKATGVPPGILAGMIWQESKGNPNVAGGGLMQIGPNEFAANGGGDIANPADNIMAGAKYLASLTAEKGGDIQKGLRAYNAGPFAPPQGGPTGDDAYIPKVLDAAEQSGLPMQ